MKKKLLKIQNYIDNILKIGVKIMSIVSIIIIEFDAI